MSSAILDRGAAPAEAGPVAERASWTRRLESPVLRLEALVGAALPERFNPLARTGGVATALLLVAIATGVALLPFYSVSPVHAHDSVIAMTQSPLTLGLLRSLHRFSSDGAILFALLHLGRLLLARRIGGTRAVAWATGAVMLAGIVAVGWLGLVLVWDDAAALLAVQTARALDGLRLFGEPIERSFLTDDGLSATLFFVVFFAHVLGPLALAVLLWLHVLKLPRVRLLPSKGLALALGAALVAGSLAWPAPLGPRAAMDVLPASVRLDAWYAAPAILAERSGATLALALAAVATALLAALPWLTRRSRRETATVHAASCNACAQCVADCPYGAIRLVPRGEAPGRAPFVAEVDASRCTSCGLCSASCEPGAIGLPSLPSLRERQVVDAWASTDAAAGAPSVIAWICSEIAAPSLRPDAAGRVEDVPGLRALVVPCAGFVHSLTIERALRRGAAAVLVVSCPDGACRYREGAAQVRERLQGLRAPALRRDRVGDAPVRLVETGHADAALLRREALAAARGRGVQLPRAAGALRIALTTIAVGLVLAVPTFALSDVSLPLARAPHGELVVSFRHPGRIAERCRDLSPEEIAALPPHMRHDRECTRGRVPVRLRVLIGGVVVHESAHEGSGLWSDGESVTIARITPAVDGGLVRVEIADGPEEEGFALGDERELRFERGARRVVLFDRNGGFQWK